VVFHADPLPALSLIRTGRNQAGLTSTDQNGLRETTDLDLISLDFTNHTDPEMARDASGEKIIDDRMCPTYHPCGLL
jgi:hypothetical protein